MSDKEKQWLSNFNEEYLSGNFNHEGRVLHKTKKEKRECYSRNNARNRDMFSIARTMGWLVGQIHLEGQVEKTIENPNVIENAVIDVLDLKMKNLTKPNNDGNKKS